MEANLEFETILLNVDNSLAASSPVTVLLARSSMILYFPVDEISMERDSPTMPPDCTIFIDHSFEGFTGDGKLVLSGSGVNDDEQPDMSSVMRSANKITERNMFISFWQA